MTSESKVKVAAEGTFDVNFAFDGVGVGDVNQYSTFDVPEAR